MNYTTNDIIKIVNAYCSKNYYKLRHLMEYEDYVQDSLLEVLTKIKKYDSTRGAISTYITSVLWRYWNRYFNSPRCTSDKLNKDMIIKDDDALDIENIAIEIEDIIHISKKMRDNIVSMLNEDTKEYYLLGIKMIDIAKKKGVTKQRISNKIRKNIKDIRKKCLHFNK